MLDRISTLKMSVMLWIILSAMALPAVAQSAEVNDAFERGNNAFHRSAYERAIFEYRNALAWPGQHQARAHFDIGVCQYKLGRLREAAAEYRTAIRLRDGKYPVASYALGTALQGLRDHREARAAFAQAVVASGGRHAEALFELGLYAQAERDTGAAVDFYVRSIKQSKNNLPASHNNLGVILAGYGQMEDAQREFELALTQSRGKFAEARDNLARCRELLSSKSRTLLAELKTSNGSGQIGPAGD